LKLPDLVKQIEEACSAFSAAASAGAVMMEPLPAACRAEAWEEQTGIRRHPRQLRCCRKDPKSFKASAEVTGLGLGEAKALVEAAFPRPSRRAFQRGSRHD